MRGTPRTGSSARRQLPTGGSKSVGSLLPGVEVVAAGPDEMVERLTNPDEFVSRQSPFDRQARLSLSPDAVEVTERIYLSYVGAQAVAWSPDEIVALADIVAAVAPELAAFPVSLPDRIVLVKTTGKEEGYAAYTRHRDTIVFPANMVASLSAATGFDDPLHPARSTAHLRGVFVHELFHLISKNNPHLRHRLYEQLGFVLFDPIELPAVPWPMGANTTMCDLAITNPDAPHVDVAIELEVANDDGELERRWLAPVLLANGPYDRGGEFFEYLEIWMLEVEERGGAWVPVDDRAGRPLLHTFESVAEAYAAKVGRNFENETFHPDEILAQSFVLIMEQPSIDLLDRLRTGLMGQ